MYYVNHRNGTIYFKRPVLLHEYKVSIFFSVYVLYVNSLIIIVLLNWIYSHPIKIESITETKTCKMFGAMHFIYYINRSIATKVESF